MSIFFNLISFWFDKINNLRYFDFVDIENIAWGKLYILSLAQVIQYRCEPLPYISLIGSMKDFLQCVLTMPNAEFFTINNKSDEDFKMVKQRPTCLIISFRDFTLNTPYVSNV